VQTLHSEEIREFLVISLWEELGIILYPKFVIIINLKQTGIKPAEQTRVAKVDIESLTCFRERSILGPEQIWMLVIVSLWREFGFVNPKCMLAGSIHMNVVPARPIRDHGS
jgi:hypothetical protein